MIGGGSTPSCPREAHLSLRRRLFLALLAILVASLALGVGLSGWQAREKLKVDMAAAMNVGRTTANRALQMIPASQRTRARAEDIVRLFDGDRHLRAGLTDMTGKVLSVSFHPLAGWNIPEWCIDLLAPTAQTARFDIEGVGRILLVTDPRLEVHSALKAMFANLVTLLAFFGALFVLSMVFLRQLLRPLSRLSEGIGRIARGDYGARISTDGPTELAALSEGFNNMAAELADLNKRNVGLGEQLAMVQDEERADLARDLHDDIGPLLFAIDVDATTIRAMTPDKPTPTETAMAERASAIQAAVADAKKRVRLILGRLRPGVVVQLGLRQNIEDLVAFIGDHHPEVTVTADVTEESFGPRIDASFHAVIREAVNNALKHGKPTGIEISVGRDHDGAVRLKIADDGGGFSDDAGQGYGIIGMRERIVALGGEFHIDPRFDVSGIVVSARIPVRGATTAKRSEED